jgi:pyrimidine operon attenuation protein/uracil phosphoribosyltransferase
MAGKAVQAAVARIARRIAAGHPGGERVVLVGIQTGGVHLARQLAARLSRTWKRPVPLGQLDVTMHRDDLDQRLAPTVHPTDIPFDVTGQEIILVDDVLCSGRTTRAALDALNDLGRPRRIQLAVLVERPHRELPIQADFIGTALRTEPADRVDVDFRDADGCDQVAVTTLLAPAPTRR